MYDTLVCECERHVTIITLLVFVLAYILVGLFNKTSVEPIQREASKRLLEKHQQEDFDFFVNETY